MPEVKQRVAAETLRSVDSSTLAGAYVPLGTAFNNPARIIKVTNDSTVGVTLSYDGGTTDHEYVPAGSFLLLDFSANRINPSEFVLPQNTTVAINGTAGTGSIYLSVYYVN